MQYGCTTHGCTYKYMRARSLGIKCCPTQTYPFSSILCALVPGLPEQPQDAPSSIHIGHGGFIFHGLCTSAHEHQL